jgi:hypothetical protein
LPAAVPMSTGCWVTFSETPLAFSSGTISCRSFNDRARRSKRVTTSVSQVRRNASSASSSVRLSRDAPLAFSRPNHFPARHLECGCWIEKSGSRIETRA